MIIMTIVIVILTNQFNQFNQLNKPLYFVKLLINKGNIKGIAPQTADQK